LFVHSAKTAPKGLEPLSKIGEDIVVIWDSEDSSTDVIFRAGYMLAKALSVRSALLTKSDTASFQKIDKAIEAIRKQLGGFVELKTTSETIQNGATKILKRVEIMSIDLERQIDILYEQFINIKGTNNSNN
jgi:septation ring formation regulator EzrA